MIVTLAQPFDVLNGPHFNLGERISLNDALARDLINRGIAIPEPEMPIPTATRTLAAPTASKMIVAPKVKKGHGAA